VLEFVENEGKKVGQLAGKNDEVANETNLYRSCPKTEHDRLQLGNLKSL